MHLNQPHLRRLRVKIILNYQLKNEVKRLILILKKIIIDHFTVVCSMTLLLNSSEAGGEVALIQTSLLLSCKYPG